MLTNSIKSMLQLQSEGHQRNLFRHGQNGDSRQVGGRITRIPLAGWGVKTQIANCRRSHHRAYVLERKQVHKHFIHT